MACPVLFVENSPMLIDNGLSYILGALSEMGYDARWGIWSSADMGACHKRERCWLFAWNAEIVQQRFGEARYPITASGAQEPEFRDTSCTNAADTMRQGLEGAQQAVIDHAQRRGKQNVSIAECDSLRYGDSRGRFLSKPVLCRGDDGLANRVGRLKAIGNGQDPRVAAHAFRTLSRGII